MRRLSGTIASILCMACSAPALAGLASGIQSDQINIGVDGMGKLKVVYTNGPVVLPEVHMMGFDGFRGDEPGFYSINDDFPMDDFFKLAPGTMLRLEVTMNFTPPFRGYTDNTFVDFFAKTGDMWEMGIGSPNTEVHPWWSVDMNDPEFDGGPWVASYKIIDASGKGYTDSDTYFVTFTPEPGSLALLMLGGLIACRRSRA